MQESRQLSYIRSRIRGIKEFLSIFQTIEPSDLKAMPESHLSHASFLREIVLPQAMSVEDVLERITEGFESLHDKNNKARDLDELSGALKKADELFLKAKSEPVDEKDEQ